MKPARKKQVGLDVERVIATRAAEMFCRDLREALDNLTSVQARCNELLEENRQLRNHLTILGVPHPK